MSPPRTWLLTIALPAFALAAPLVLALAQPAWADIRTDASAAPSRHQGVAFAPRKGAKARIVEPDGRVVTTDGASDLVAPASIASRQAQTAIARLINAEMVDKGAEVQSLPEAAAGVDSGEAAKTAPRREANRGLKFSNVTPGV